ncbi:GNAT family N-acetyltransferase [Acidisphaera sp. S103]|uniref:GNAT family N-acetyltransferase n=1 Tax=Acidisphaera sp. S103 TaxID=1747223 RepID=UPI001C20A96D|nr:GNAT family N-acetyltransferase [Acidisphaera sp. S103]
MTTRELCMVYPPELSGEGSLGTDLLALNNADAQALSWLEPKRLAHLVQQSFLARRIGQADAFLLAFDQDADYDSVNFLWFRARYERFVYVDRIVVAPAARGRGYARQLYMDLFQHASRAGHRLVVCEINADPPNPVSDAFHAALGFVTVGSEIIQGGSKTVRYACRDIGAPPNAFHADG